MGNDLPAGAIDLHVHVGPDYMPRFSDALELAEESQEAGMRAILIKGHLSSTVAYAYAASKVTKGISVFGGITLNEPNGAFNVRNVITCIKSGGKMIWLPTVDAAYAVRKAEEGHWIKHYVNGSLFGYKRTGLSILDEKNGLIDELNDILRLCKESDLILGTGHISPQEALILAREAKNINYKKLEITHPNAWLEDFTIPVIQELIGMGASITLSYGVCSDHNGGQDPREIVDVIRNVGAENCCLITDYGQVIHPSPVEGLKEYCRVLLGLGVTEKEIELMLCHNPARLLGL